MSVFADFEWHDRTMDILLTLIFGYWVVRWSASLSRERGNALYGLGLGFASLAVLAWVLSTGYVREQQLLSQKMWTAAGMVSAVTVLKMVFVLIGCRIARHLLSTK